jgi:exodeoxyribonuclease VII small subunit
MAKRTNPAPTGGDTPRDDREAIDDLRALAYVDAVRELDEILAELEDDDIDVDRLTSRVKRAAALVSLCRERILEARVEIEQILEEPLE